MDPKENRLKLTFDVEKVIILRIRGNAETINMELSAAMSERVDSNFANNGCSTLKLFVPRGTAEKVCAELGIPEAIVETIDDTKSYVPKFSKPKEGS
jgi:hypothetical protein